MADDDDGSDGDSSREFEMKWKLAQEERKKKKEEKKRKSSAVNVSSSISSDDDNEKVVTESKANQSTDENHTSKPPDVVVVDTSTVKNTPAKNKVAADSSSSSSKKKASSTAKKKRKKKTPPPAEPLPVITEPQCRAIYTKNNCKRKLFVMCIGQTVATETESGDLIRLLGNAEEGPHANMKNKSKCKPTTDDMMEELKRRCWVLGVPVPMHKSWKKPRLQKWLMDHPMTNETDVECLKEQELIYYTALINFNKQKEEESTEKKIQWRTDLPFRRLYHCAADDRAKAALRILLRAKDHQELDGRHSDKRPETHYEIVAKLYNDILNIYWTYSLPELHGDFAHSVELKLEDMPGGVENGKITPEDVKERLGSSNAQLEKIVADFEKSGKGHGSLVEVDGEEEAERSHGTDDDSELELYPASHGRLSDERKHEVGDQRSNFVRGMATHVLYYWELCDRQDIIRHVLCTVNKDVRVSSRNPASDTAVVKRPRNGKGGDNNQSAGDEAAASVGMAMSNLACDTCTENLTNHRTRLLDMKLQKLKATTTEEKELYDQVVKDLEKEVLALEKRQSTLFKNIS